jgi:hypothetical protein
MLIWTCTFTHNMNTYVNLRRGLGVTSGGRGVEGSLTQVRAVLTKTRLKIVHSPLSPRRDSARTELCMLHGQMSEMQGDHFAHFHPSPGTNRSALNDCGVANMTCRQGGDQV